MFASEQPLANILLRRLERDLLRAIEHGDRAAILILQSHRTSLLNRVVRVN